MLGSGGRAKTECQNLRGRVGGGRTILVLFVQVMVPDLLPSQSIAILPYAINISTKYCFQTFPWRTPENFCGTH